MIKLLSGRDRLGMAIIYVRCRVGNNNFLMIDMLSFFFLFYKLLACFYLFFDLGLALLQSREEFLRFVKNPAFCSFPSLYFGNDFFEPFFDEIS